ncbi:MAG: SGNH/GDSL hydrolase family protein [Clostridia bacterium]|nr:SGNH/GDSL hydrolase family protein [Clostridia bacterium]
MDIEKIFKFNDESELPLEKLVDDGGFTAVFRKIGCVGDSLSSGEHESLDADGKKGYHDYYEHSWGQYIARTIGAEVYNFSKGGMRADTYCESFAESKGFWNPELRCDAYIIALGVNDVTKFGKELGNTDTDIDFNDWRNNSPTFVGYYAQIIQRLREIEPKSRIFLMTMPRSTGAYAESRAEAYDLHREILYKLANLFDFTYVLDFRRYAPVYDEEFKKRFYLGGHLNSMGYMLTAKMVMSYIDYIIRHNTEDFVQVGFIGKGGVHHKDRKW